MIIDKQKELANFAMALDDVQKLGHIPAFIITVDPNAVFKVAAIPTVRCQELMYGNPVMLKEFLYELIKHMNKDAYVRTDISDVPTVGPFDPKPN